MITEILKQSTNGTSAVEFVHAGFRSRTMLIISGDMADRLVTIEMRAPDGSWVPVDGGTFDAAIATVLDAPPFRGRVRLDGAGAGEVTVWVATGEPSLLTGARE